MYDNVDDNVIELEAIDLEEVLDDIIQIVISAVHRYRFTRRASRTSSQYPIHFLSDEYLEGKAQSLVRDAELREFLGKHGLTPVGVYFLVGQHLCSKLISSPRSSINSL